MTGDWNEALHLADAVKRAVAASGAASPSAANAQVAGSSARPGAVSPQTLTIALATDPEFEQAVSTLLSEQLARTHQVDPVRRQLVTSLVAILAGANPSLHVPELRSILEDGHKAANLAQLAENEQLGRLIHAGFTRAGLVTEFDYRRSEAHKRIVRRRIYLSAHPSSAFQP